MKGEIELREYTDSFDMVDGIHMIYKETDESELPRNYIYFPPSNYELLLKMT